MFENFTLDNLENSNYFGENIGIIDQNYSEEPVEFLGSEFYGNFYACELLLQKDGNNDILPVYINKYGLILNFYGNIVTYVGEVINLDGSEYQKLYIKNIENFLANEKEIYVSINKSNFSFNIFTVNIENEEYVTFNEINIEKEIENNGYYSTGSNILEIYNNNYIQHIGNKEYTFKGFYENKKFRKISFNGARKNNFFVDIYEGLYLETNISIYDLVNTGYKAGSLIDRIVRYDGYNLQVGNLGYSYYQVIDPEKKVNNRAIYNYEDDKYITDIKFGYIGSIENENSKIIVGQYKKSWKFQIEMYYGVFDLNKRKLIKSCRYNLEDIQEYIKSTYEKLLNTYERNLDPDLQQAIFLAAEYENQKKIAEQKQKDFLKKEEMLKIEKEKVQSLEKEVVEEMQNEYQDLENNLQKLNEKKKLMEEKYGMNIVDILKSVEEYK